MTIQEIFVYSHIPTQNNMDQPKVERMLRMIQLLASNVEYSIDDLMERLDMSRRTVYRYLDTFKEAGFAVQKVNPSGNVYRLATLRKPFADLSKVVYFSDEEAYIVNSLMDQLDNNSPIKQGLRKKLAAVYDISTITSFGGRKSNSAVIDALTTAIKEKKAVILHRYSSSHSKTTKDYKVEPYRLNNNCIDIWAYDLADGINKRFKVSRVDEVEILDEPWQAGDRHEDEPLDAFRMHGHEPTHVKLRMDYVAKNLLVEEFPMAEKGLTQDGDRWIWEGDVRGMDGVGRFVLGLPMFIEVLEGDELRSFLREHAMYILNDMGV